MVYFLKMNGRLQVRVYKKTEFFIIASNRVQWWEHDMILKKNYLFVVPSIYSQWDFFYEVLS